jgi:YidC/Oxa1 family membrane protein insertase
MYHVALRGTPGSLAGVPLTAHLATGLPVFAVLLAMAAVLAWWSARRIRRAAASATQPAPPGAGFIARLMPWLPYLTVLAVAYLPLAGALYLVTSTSWTALEQALWRRPVITGNG